MPLSVYGVQKLVTQSSTAQPVRLQGVCVSCTTVSRQVESCLNAVAKEYDQLHLEQCTTSAPD